MEWNTLLSSNTDVDRFSRFATGRLSGRQLYADYAGTSRGGIVRSLVRSGVGRARNLTRKALRRRGVSV